MARTRLAPVRDAPGAGTSDARRPLLPTRGSRWPRGRRRSATGDAQLIERRAMTVLDITEAPMSASTFHVEPNVKGRWIVRHEDELEPRSEHESATEAMRVACELA